MNQGMLPQIIPNQQNQQLNHDFSRIMQNLDKKQRSQRSDLPNNLSVSLDYQPQPQPNTNFGNQIPVTY